MNCVRLDHLLGQDLNQHQEYKTADHSLRKTVSLCACEYTLHLAIVVKADGNNQGFNAKAT
jgi:hypothetical protein